MSEYKMIRDLGYAKNGYEVHLLRMGCYRYRVASMQNPSVDCVPAMLPCRWLGNGKRITYIVLPAVAQSWLQHHRATLHTLQRPEIESLSSSYVFLRDLGYAKNSYTLRLMKNACQAYQQAIMKNPATPITAAMLPCRWGGEGKRGAYAVLPDEAKTWLYRYHQRHATTPLA